MPKIVANNLNLHYWLSGKGPDVVLVHGLGGNLAAWHLTMVPELQRDYRVLTYDLRGHGRSDAPAMGYTTGDMVADLRGLLDAVGIEKAAFVGHSWGADIVLHFAMLYPDRVSRMVLVEAALLAPMAHNYRRPDWDGWSYVTDTIATLTGQPIPEEHRLDLEYLLKQLILVPIQFGPTQGRPRDEELVFRVLDVLRPMWEGREAEGNMGLQSMDAIAQPALLLYESNSVFLDCQKELGQRLPNVSSVVLPGARLKHFSSLEHPDLVAANVRSFLKEYQESALNPTPAR